MHSTRRMLARDRFLTDLLQIDHDFGGHHFKIPTVYRDAASVTATFPARAAELRRLLPPELRATPLAPGVGAVSVTFFHYRDTDIGPYEEVAVSILAAYARRPVPLVTATRELRRSVVHLWIQQLPVTTEVACVGGVELFGYPKFVAGIDFEETEGRFAGAIHHEGRRVLALAGAVPERGPRDVPMRFVTYSRRQGRLLETQVLGRAETVATTWGGDLRLALDEDHPVARELAAVLLRRQPIVVQHTPRFQSILHAPVVLE